MTVGPSLLTEHPSCFPVVYCGMLRMVWFGTIWCGMVWCGFLYFGMVRCGAVHFGEVCFGIVDSVLMSDGRAMCYSGMVLSFYGVV